MSYPTVAPRGPRAPGGRGEPARGAPAPSRGGYGREERAPRESRGPTRPSNAPSQAYGRDRERGPGHGSPTSYRERESTGRSVDPKLGVRRDSRAPVRDSRAPPDDRRDARRDTRSERPDSRFPPAQDRGFGRGPNRGPSHAPYGGGERREFGRPERFERREERPFERREERPPVREEPKEKKLERINKLLEDLESVPTIDKVEILDSKWDVKPKGFETVSAERAKLSGLFPLPGHPRPVDTTKLEGALKGRNENNGVSDILFDQSKIDSSDSRNAKRIIISDIDFDQMDYLKVVNHFNKFLANLDIPESQVQNIEHSKKSIDDKILVIEFKNNILATTAFTLNGTKIPEIDAALNLRRPGEYVVSSVPKKSENPDPNLTIPDSPNKITITKLSTAVEASKLSTSLNNIGSINRFQIIVEKESAMPTGIAFVEIKEERDMKHFIEALNELSFEGQTVVAFASCVGPKHATEVNYESLPHLAVGDRETKHKTTKVIQLVNCITPKDLVADSFYESIKKDITDECNKFGKVVDIKIPRPPHDYTPGVDQFLEPGIGKIFIKFQSLEGSSKGVFGLAGRKYNDRTVIASFFNDEDYELNLF